MYVAQLEQLDLSGNRARQLRAADFAELGQLRVLELGAQLQLEEVQVRESAVPFRARQTYLMALGMATEDLGDLPGLYPRNFS